MEFSVGTYNLQRISSDEMVDVLWGLKREVPCRILCLQEVVPQMKEKLLRCFPSAIRDGENMIIYPEEFHLVANTSFNFSQKGKSFLSWTFHTERGNFTVFTGKLQHGPFFWNADARFDALRMLLRQLPKTPRIYALDTNFVYKEEHDDTGRILDRDYFGVTSHPEWTHVLSRLEPKNFIYWFLRLYGRLSWKRSELDKILYSNDFQLINSQVKQKETLSDHEPVVAQLHFRE